MTQGQVLCEIDTEMVESAQNSMDSASVALSEAQSNLSRMQIDVYKRQSISWYFIKWQPPFPHFVLPEVQRPLPLRQFSRRKEIPGRIVHCRQIQYIKKKDTCELSNFLTQVEKARPPRHRLPKKIKNFLKKQLPISKHCAILSFVLRECWNWQTGKTKDLAVSYTHLWGKLPYIPPKVCPRI